MHHDRVLDAQQRKGLDMAARLQELTGIECEVVLIGEPERDGAGRMRLRQATVSAAAMRHARRPSKPTLSRPTAPTFTRPRERRERRHVARSTSGADSGGDDPAEPPRGETHAVELSRIAQRLRKRGGVG